jgi:hypothetical protein
MIDMKKLLITVLLLASGISYASAQRGSIDKPLTQEQRMVQSNSKHKKGKNNADVSKKVKRAKKQDRAARKRKAPKNNAHKHK